MDAKQVIAELQRMIAAEGVRPLCRRLGLDPPYVSRVANGLQPAGPSILAALGFERVEVFRKSVKRKASR